jgi:hypothetical protein
LTAPTYPARRGGRSVGRLTVEQYWALPEPKRSKTEVQMQGRWVRPHRFVSDGSDITFEDSKP